MPRLDYSHCHFESQIVTVIYCDDDDDGDNEDDSNDDYNEDQSAHGLNTWHGNHVSQLEIV